MKTLKFLILLLILGGTFGRPVQAEEEMPAGMDPMMMEKMQTLMAPNEKHAALAAFEGEWEYDGYFWMTPDAEPQEMVGMAKNEMSFGGRFLKQEFEGPWMGEMFKGLGYTGYDNVKGEYVTVWLDNMMTGVMTFSGSFNEATQTLAQEGKNSCPMTGKTDQRGRSEWKVIDADHNVYTSYGYTEDGNEFKAMEIHYTRDA